MLAGASSLKKYPGGSPICPVRVPGRPVPHVTRPQSATHCINPNNSSKCIPLHILTLSRLAVELGCAVRDCGQTNCEHNEPRTSHHIIMNKTPLKVISPKSTFANPTF